MTMRILITAVLLVFPALSGEALTKDPVRIGDLRLLTNGEEVRVIVETSKELTALPSASVPEERLLQFDIEGSFMDRPSRSFSVDDTLVESVEVFRLDDQTVRLKLHLLDTLGSDGFRVWKGEEGFIVSLRKADGAASGDREDGAVRMVEGDETRAEKRVNGRGGIEEAFPGIFGVGPGVSSSAVSPKTGRDEDVEMNPVVKMISSLALVLGLFLVGAYFLRERLMKRGTKGKGSLIRVLERGYVDIKKSVAIVDIAGEVIVLGTSGEGVTMLTKIENEEALARLRRLYGEGRDSFQDAVKSATAGIKDETPTTLREKIGRLRPLR